MTQHISRNRGRFAHKSISFFLIFAFTLNLTFIPVPQAHAQSLLNLPVPGTMVSLSPAFTPAIVSGITLHPENPLQFDFIVDTGDDRLEGAAFKEESQKLISYFFAALTVPEKEMWVNLSPYEKDRIMADGLGNTVLGKDMLAQDYILKQVAASLMYPEEGLGEEFWERVYERAQAQFGTTDIPTNTFNKVWIVPDKATVYVNGNNAFVVESSLKVMLEKDYLLIEDQLGNSDHGLTGAAREEVESMTEETANIVREVLLPEIQREVNQGKNFAPLRQIYNSMILAAWYKKNLKESVLGAVYMDRNKTEGVAVEDKTVKQQIYERYLEAFKKGVFDYIKEDVDPATQEIIPRKYFSGGVDYAQIADAVVETLDTISPALSGQFDQRPLALVQTGAGLVTTETVIPEAVWGNFHTVTIDRPEFKGAVFLIWTETKSTWNKFGLRGHSITHRVLDGGRVSVTMTAPRGRQWQGATSQENFDSLLENLERSAGQVSLTSTLGRLMGRDNAVTRFRAAFEQFGAELSSATDAAMISPALEAAVQEAGTVFTLGLSVRPATIEVKYDDGTVINQANLTTTEDEFLTWKKFEERVTGQLRKNGLDVPGDLLDQLKGHYGLHLTYVSYYPGPGNSGYDSSVFQAIFYKLQKAVTDGPARGSERIIQEAGLEFEISLEYRGFEDEDGLDRESDIESAWKEFKKRVTSKLNEKGLAVPGNLEELLRQNYGLLYMDHKENRAYRPSVFSQYDRSEYSGAFGRSSDTWVGPSLTEDTGDAAMVNIILNFVVEADYRNTQAIVESLGFTQHWQTIKTILNHGFMGVILEYASNRELRTARDPGLGLDRMVVGHLEFFAKSNGITDAQKIVPIMSAMFDDWEGFLTKLRGMGAEFSGLSVLMDGRDSQYGGSEELNTMQEGKRIVREAFSKDNQLGDILSIPALFSCVSQDLC